MHNSYRFGRADTSTRLWAQVDLLRVFGVKVLNCDDIKMEENNRRFCAALGRPVEPYRVVSSAASVAKVPHKRRCATREGTQILSKPFRMVSTSKEDSGGAKNETTNVTSGPGSDDQTKRPSPPVGLLGEAVAMTAPRSTCTNMESESSVGPMDVDNTIAVGDQIHLE